MGTRYSRLWCLLIEKDRWIEPYGCLVRYRYTKAMDKPKGILFDLGNTILHESRYNPRAGAKCLLDNAANSGQLSQDELERVTLDLYQEIRHHHRKGVIEYSIQSFLRLICEQVGIQCNVSFPELELAFWREIASMAPEPDVGSMLDELDELRIPVES